MNQDNRLAELSLPDQKSYDVAYNLALKMAGEKLNNCSDFIHLCRRSGSIYDSTGHAPVICTQYLKQTYRITLPDISVSLIDSGDEVGLRDKILILHYLDRAGGTPLSGKLISYQELEEGAAYYPSFFQRAVKPLVEHFGQAPEELVSAAADLGGEKAEYGDIAVVIPAFSRVPLTYIVWKGDDEFPPDATILFDSTILDYLSAEDINVLCQTVTWKMVKAGSRNH
ncbi:MAG: DUF3786 domain-containing protein [Dehalococcoidales bacterium]|nr:DUF3786 domain-containing protein [Dehalococcoidales bacterium]